MPVAGPPDRKCVPPPWPADGRNSMYAPPLASAVVGTASSEPRTADATNHRRARIASPPWEPSALLRARPRRGSGWNPPIPSGVVPHESGSKLEEASDAHEALGPRRGRPHPGGVHERTPSQG